MLEENTYIGQSEKLWLSRVYRRMQDSNEADSREIMLELHDLLDKDFDHTRIDLRFYDENELTILGIWLFDPNSQTIKDAERVILSIAEILRIEPQRDEITASELAAKLQIDEIYIKKLLRLMGPVGHFWSSASTEIDGIGYSRIGLNDKTDNILRNYLDFTNIEDAIRSELARYARPIEKVAPSHFETPREVEKNTVFVIMQIDPRKPELEDIYNAIKETCEKFELEAIRADEIEHQEQITKIILDRIERCEHLIADLSGERPNVYYEIGYAHALNKKPGAVLDNQPVFSLRSCFI